VPSILLRLLLFVSSYFPLACILGLLFYEKYPWFAKSAVVVAGLGVVGLLVYLSRARQLSSVPVIAQQVRRLDMEAMTYLVTYLIPFVAVPSDAKDKRAALSLFFVVLALLYVNSNMIHINPMLNVFGYHLYEVTLVDGGVHVLITRSRVRTNQLMEVVRVGDDVLIERGV
jgi:hypothetical protein